MKIFFFRKASLKWVAALVVVIILVVVLASKLF